MSDKTVKLFNKDFVISTEKYNALAIQNMFRNLANDAFDEYTEFFNKNITDLKDLVTSCPKVIGGVFHNTSKKIVERLSKYDIYDISSDTIEQTFIDNGKALDAYELLCDKYEAILDNQAELDAYRTARRQNRGRVVGGGFGLSGAVKGMATAGAMNMAAGAAHGAFNMAGKVASSIGAAIEKDSIFSSEKSSKTIAHGIWKDIYCACNTYMNILQKNNIDFEKGLISIEDNIVEVRKDISTDRVVTKAPKSLSGQRTIPISSALNKYLKTAHKDYLIQRLKMGKRFFDGDYVVHQSNGKPYKPASFSSKFNDFLKKHDLKHIRLHDLRHTNATIMLSQGISPKVAQMRLGHSDFSTTMNIYSHVLKSVETQAAEKIENAIFKDIAN